MARGSSLVNHATTIWVSRHGSSSDGHLPFQAQGSDEPGRELEHAGWIGLGLKQS
jgi:hypothetical protein